MTALIVVGVTATLRRDRSTPATTKVEVQSVYDLDVDETNGRALIRSLEGLTLLGLPGGDVLRVFPELAGRGVVCSSLSPTGNLASLGCLRGEVLLLPLDSHQSPREITKVETVRRLAFSHSGQLLAIGQGGNDQPLVLWDLAADRARFELDAIDGTVHVIRFSPDDRYLAAITGDRSVHVWETSDGRLVRRIAGDEQFMSLDVSPDGRTLVTGSQAGRLQLWEIESGHNPWTADTGRFVSVVSFSPDGETVACSAGLSVGQLYLYSVEDGARQRTFAEKHDKMVREVIFSRDGRRLYSGSYDGTVGVWSVSTGQRVQSITP